MVRVGYKQTEVGVIPEDWEVITLKKIIRSLQSGVSVNSKDSCIFNESEYFILKTSCVYSGLFFPEESKLINKSDINRARLNPKKNSIIISRMNTPDLVGEIGYVDKSYKNVFIPDRLWSASFYDEDLNVKWLSYILSFSASRAVIKEMATGTSNSMKNISKPIFLELKISFPNQKEQTAIATALSDIDALITTLTELIDKKRQIKTATMQQLLIGKQRLAGFGEGKGMKSTELGEIPEDWEVMPLKNFIKSLDAGVSVNSLEATFFDEHQSYILKTSCISKGVFNPTECKEILKSELKRAKITLKPDTIIISRMNTPDLVGEIGYISKNYPNLFLPDRLWITSFNKAQINVKWLSTILCYRPIREKIKEMATGTSNSMKNISKADLLDLKIPCPTYLEQQAIAQVLSDMDDDLNALETRLTKTKAIKQGMMQELLTGRTRLI